MDSLNQGIPTRRKVYFYSLNNFSVIYASGWYSWQFLLHIQLYGIRIKYLRNISHVDSGYISFSCVYKLRKVIFLTSCNCWSSTVGDQVAVVSNKLFFFHWESFHTVYSGTQKWGVIYWTIQYNACDIINAIIRDSIQYNFIL